MILALLFAYYGYKKAEAAGRNGIAWALIALAVFIGTQLLIGLAIGIFLGFGIEAFGWSDSLIENYAMLINIAAIIGGLIGGFAVLWYLGREPATNQYVTPPPPPPNFGGEQ